MLDEAATAATVEWVQWLLAGAFGILGAAIWEFVKRKRAASKDNTPAPHQKVGTEEVAARPHIQPTLIVEKEGQGVRFRLNIENIGDIRIAGLRTSFNTPGAASIESELANPRDMPPGGQVTVSGSPAFDLYQSRRLRVVVSYRATINDVDTEFTSRFLFVLPYGEITACELQPESYEEVSGKFFGDELIKIMEGWASEVGTLAMGLPEKRTDGSPNRFQLLNAKRMLLFDPALRVVWFNSISSSGVTFGEHINFQKADSHVVVAVWNDTGVEIYVDGVGRGKIGTR